jgi:hypothetical protein
MPETLGSLILSAIAVEGSATVLSIGSFTVTASQVATAVASVALAAGSAAISASAMSQSPADPGTAQTPFRQAIPARRRYYGVNRIAGAMMLVEVRDGVQYNLYALCDGPIEAIDNLWLNDEIITVDGSGGVQEYPYQGLDAPFSPIVFVFTQLGESTQAALSKLTTDLSDIWTSDHRLRGVATMLVAAGSVPPQSFLTVFPGGMPKGSVEGRFAKLYDPRLDSTVPTGSGSHRIATSSTWEYAANPVLILLDYLKHADGHAIPASYFDGVLEDWGDEAAICDETVALKAGGTVARWAAHGGYSFDEPRKDVVGRILEAMDGWLYLRADGKIGVRAGKLRTPTVTLTDQDVTGYEVQNGADALSAANTIRASYVSPDHDYQRVDAEPWIDTADVAIRGSKDARLDLAMVQNFSQARRLMKRAALRANPRQIVTLTTTIMGLQAFGERYVELDIPSENLVGIYENVGASIDTGTMTCTLSLRSVPDDLDDWDAATEEGTAPPIPDEAGDSGSETPASLAATVGTVDIGGGVLQPQMTISCATPSDGALTFRPEYKRNGAAGWTQVTVAAGTWSVATGPLAAGVYSVRARFVKGGVILPLSNTLTGINVGLPGTGGDPALDFSDADNSQYLPIL